MMVRLPIRMTSTLIALVMALGLAVSAAAVTEPVVIPSTTWTTTGTMKVKVGPLSQEVAATVTLEFGPNGVDLLDGQFRLTVDDGVDPVSFVGVYEELKPGKPTFPDLGDIVAAAMGIAPDLPGLEVSTKIKAKPKLKDGVETIRIAFKIKLKMSIEGQSMSIAVGYKGDGGPVE